MNIAFNDVFKKNINKNTEMYNGFKRYNELYNGIRSFSISAYYRFGKNKSKAKRKIYQKKMKYDYRNKKMAETEKPAMSGCNLIHYSL